MKRTTSFFFVFLFLIQAYTQSKKNWINDLDTLQSKLLQKEYLFVNFSKKKFKKEIVRLKNNFNENKELNYWNLNHILNDFNIPTLEVSPVDFVRFPFKVKQFQGKYYITSINFKNESFLGWQLLKINNYSITSIVKKENEINNINIKSFLEFYKITNSNSITLELLSYNNKEEIINLTLNSDDETIDLKPKSQAFYLQKTDRWFWQYGINFGQQMYFKFNIGLSKEFIDSLSVTKVTVSRQNRLPLQTIYDAPNFDDFTKKLFEKLKKRRYKKLFIDFRNMKSANDLILDKFISKLKKSRINNSNKLFIFIDKSISKTAVKMIYKLKSKTKAKIIGEKIKGVDCNTNQVSSFYLPNSEFKIYYPIKNFKPITIEPDIYIKYTFSQYINGIDAIIQTVLNN